MSDKGNNSENFEKVALIMKKTHFWKYVAFGTSCIRQEFAVYEQLAKDRFFDMSKFLRKTVERFWKAAATGYSMDEQYIFAVEESFFVPRDGWEELALQFVQDLHDFFYAVADYIENRKPERVRGFWYLNALSWLRAYQLREKGYPIKWVPYFERHESGKEGFQPVFFMMLSA